MAKLTLNDIQGQYASTTELNANFALIETALENTLSRDGTTPNTMSADLDMNSNDVNNADTVNTVNLIINGSSVVPSGVYTATASNITNVPAGDIVSTDVQAAITELDTEKVPETDFSAFGKTLIDDATASDARTTLGLGTVATESTVPVAKGGTGEITAQAAIDTLSNVSAATNEHVLTKDTATGNAVFKASAGSSPATTTSEGIVELATQVEVDAGTDATRAVVPGTLANSHQVCKAWVNFNGTGTVATRDSFNISSITDNGTGDYTINFTNAMSDTNYSAVTMARSAADSDYDMASVPWLNSTKTVSAYQIITSLINETATNEVDSSEVNMIVFGSTA